MSSNLHICDPSSIPELQHPASESERHILTTPFPYAAIDLLRSSLQPHRYRHDVESIFYTLVWHATSYNDKQLVISSTTDVPHHKWFSEEDHIALATNKLEWLSLPECELQANFQCEALLYSIEDIANFFMELYHRLEIKKALHNVQLLRSRRKGLADGLLQVEQDEVPNSQDVVLSEEEEEFDIEKVTELFKNLDRSFSVVSEDANNLSATAIARPPFNMSCHIQNVTSIPELQPLASDSELQKITTPSPYAAIDLLRSSIQPHRYRHDVESIFYTLVWHVTSYNDKQLVSSPPMDAPDHKWFSENDRLALAANKRDWLSLPECDLQANFQGEVLLFAIEDIANFFTVSYNRLKRKRDDSVHNQEEDRDNRNIQLLRLRRKGLVSLPQVQQKEIPRSKIPTSQDVVLSEGEEDFNVEKIAGLFQNLDRSFPVTNTDANYDSATAISSVL